MNKLSFVIELVFVEVIDVKVVGKNIFIFKEVVLVLVVDKIVVVIPLELVEVKLEVFSVVVKLNISVVVTLKKKLKLIFIPNVVDSTIYLSI